jgi:tRNA pseudouridine38-40 synthase
MQRYFIKLSYDGTNYHGWQSQDNANTIQSEVEKALSVLFSQKNKITGAGRTDTGVHAIEFYAHFDVDDSFNNDELHDLIYRFNAILPPEIAVSGILPVNKDAHARFSAISRTYKYYISKNKDPFAKDYSWCVYGNLNIEAMNNAAKILFEYTDFTSFSKLHTNTNNNNCKIFQAEWEGKNNMLVFTITADRFLRNMVRAIVGTLLDIGKGKITTDDFRKIIENKNRCDAGYSVPAKGLFLENIEYPKDLFLS